MRRRKRRNAETLEEKTTPDRIAFAGEAERNVRNTKVFLRLKLWRPWDLADRLQSESSMQIADLKSQEKQENVTLY